MLAAKRVRGFRGFLVGLIFSAAWGALVGLCVNQFSPLKLAAAWLGAVEIGAIVGAGLFLVHQAPLGGAFLALRRKAAWTNVLFWPLLLAYHLAAFPGVLIGRATGLLAWAGAPADQPAGTAGNRSAPAGTRCPWEGRVIAEYSTEFRGTQWSPGESIFEIHEDWRVSSEKLRYWGWVDREGNVREGAGPGENDERPIVATLRGEGAYIGAKKLGVLRLG